MKVVKQEVQKKQEVVERQKAEAATAKKYKNRKSINLPNKDDDNYYNDIDNTNPDQEDNLNLV